MARGGKREGAGRPAGSRDRATVEQKGALHELAREHTATALNTLVRVASSSTSDAAAVSAATAILDRAYGKPSQAVELSGKDGEPIEFAEVSPSEAGRRIAFALARAQRSKPDSPKE